MRIEPSSLQELRAAQERIQGAAVRTPLISLALENSPCEIFLKLEVLQPIGSFKIRGASNAMASVGRESLRKGVYTASAGNMAQGVAWNARRLDVPCSVVVPEHAPATKLEAIGRLGAKIVKVPLDEWWQVIVDHRYPPLDDHVFIHPVSDPLVVAGNGTIGLELLQDLPDLDAVVVPYGGGGLSCGIASAMDALKPSASVFAAEVATAAPLARALQENQPADVDYQPSFVDGVGSRRVLEEMWPMASTLLADSVVVGLDAVADAIRLLVERSHVVAEGAGALGVAAALTGRAGHGKVVCVVSGGNIDSHTLGRILLGQEV